MSHTVNPVAESAKADAGSGSRSSLKSIIGPSAVAQSRGQRPDDQDSDFALERESSCLRQTVDVEHLSPRPLCNAQFPWHRVGFVFTDADPFCGIDLDQCRTVN